MELARRPKHADTSKNGSDSRTTITGTSTTSRGSSGNISNNNGGDFPALKGSSRIRLHDLYVANSAELTKHISNAAGASEILWGDDQWSMRWYEAAPSSPSPSYSPSPSPPSPASSHSSSRGTANGPESHSIVKHASIPTTQIGCVVDVVLSRFQTRPIGWVIGPGDGLDQGQLEVVLIDRGLSLEDEQPVMLIDLEKLSLSSPSSVGSGSIRCPRVMPWDPTSALSCGRKRGRPSTVTTNATATATTTATATATATSCASYPYHVDSDIYAYKSSAIFSSALRPEVAEGYQQQKQQRQQQKQQQEQQQQLKSGLSDYKTQLGFLEQQDKKRSMIQREPDHIDSGDLGQRKRQEKRQMLLDFQRMRFKEEMQLESYRRAEMRKQLVSLEQNIIKTRREIDGAVTKRPRQHLEQHLEQQQDSVPRPSGHALRDYNLQLMLLEQQNRKRLMIARSGQDSLRAPPETWTPGKERDEGEDNLYTHCQPYPPPYPIYYQPYYEPLNLIPEQRGGEALVCAKGGDDEQEKKQQQCRPCKSVHTDVGDFHAIEKSEGEPESESELEPNDGERPMQRRQYGGPSSSPPLPPPTSPERKPHILKGGILITLLVLPAEVETWVRTWAHQARGPAGEADIAHWTAVYRALVSTLPPSQFAMYFARRDARVVGTGYLHLHAGVAVVSFSLSFE